MKTNCRPFLKSVIRFFDHHYNYEFLYLYPANNLIAQHAL